MSYATLQNNLLGKSMEIHCIQYTNSGRKKNLLSGVVGKKSYCMTEDQKQNRSLSFCSDLSLYMHLINLILKAYYLTCFCKHRNISAPCFQRTVFTYDALTLVPGKTVLT